MREIGTHGSVRVKAEPGRLGPALCFEPSGFINPACARTPLTATAPMDGQISIHIDPQLLEAVIERAVEKALSHRRTETRTEAANEGPLMYTERQASEKLGLTLTGLKEERLKGRIGFLRRGRQIRYLREHLLAYIEQWKKATES